MVSWRWRMKYWQWMVWTLQKWDTTKLGIIWSSLRMGKFTSRLDAIELKSNGFFFGTIRSWIAWVKLSVCFNYLSENFIRMNLKEWRDCQIVINCGLLASPKWRELSNIMMGLVNQVWFFSLEKYVNNDALMITNSVSLLLSKFYGILSP